MADGSVAVAEMIRRLRECGSMVDRMAPAVAVAAKREVIATASAQERPDGKAWAPGKDGQPVLRGVAGALQATAVGTRVVLRLDGHYARHHVGAVRGGKKGSLRRQILPTGTMPAPMTRAIERVAEDEFKKTMGGAR
jgi:hypothetical protein